MALAPWTMIAGPTGDTPLSSITQQSQLLSPTGDTVTLKRALNVTIPAHEPIYSFSTDIVGDVSATGSQQWKVSHQDSIANLTVLNEVLDFTQENIDVSYIHDYVRQFEEKLAANDGINFVSSHEGTAIYSLESDSNDVLFPGAAPVHVTQFVNIDEATTSDIRAITADEDAIKSVSPTVVALMLSIMFTPLPGIIFGYRVSDNNPKVLDMVKGTQLFEYTKNVVEQLGGGLTVIDGNTTITGLDHIIIPIFSQFAYRRDRAVADFLAVASSVNVYSEFPNLHLYLGFSYRMFFSDDTGHYRGRNESAFALAWPALIHNSDDRDRMVATVMTVLSQDGGSPNVSPLQEDVVTYVKGIHVLDQASPDDGMYASLPDYGLGLLAGHGVDITALSKSPGGVTFLARSAGIVNEFQRVRIPAFVTGEVGGLVAVTVYVSAKLRHYAKNYGRLGSTTHKRLQFLSGLLYDNTYTSPGDGNDSVDPTESEPYAMIAVEGKTSDVVMSLIQSLTTTSSVSMSVIHNTLLRNRVRMIGICFGNGFFHQFLPNAATGNIFTVNLSHDTEKFTNQRQLVMDASTVQNRDNIPPLFFRSAFLYCQPVATSSPNILKMFIDEDQSYYIAVIRESNMFIYSRLLNILDGSVNPPRHDDSFYPVLSTVDDSVDVYARKKVGVDTRLAIAPVIGRQLSSFDETLVKKCADRVKKGDVSVFADTIDNLSIFDKTAIVTELKGSNKQSLMNVPTKVAMNTMLMLLSCGLPVTEWTRWENGFTTIMYCRDPNYGVNVDSCTIVTDHDPYDAVIPVGSDTIGSTGALAHGIQTFFPARDALSIDELYKF